MKFRSLATFPLVFAAAFSLVALLLVHDATPAVLTAENEVGKIVAAFGCFAAALSFERGDYLRRAWTYSGACYVLLLLADAAGLPVLGTHLGERPVDATQGTLVVLANAASVVGTWMLARAWSVAGLDDDGESRSRRRMLFGAALLLAIAITGWPLVHDVRELLHGDLGALVSIASDLGDTLCLALVAPVLQTALAMRGGLLRWPWGLLTASGLAWLLYDAGSGIVEALHVEGVQYLVATEALRSLACAAFLSAGLAQRRIVLGDAAVSAQAAP